jgi:hypothetical protein
LNWDIPEEWEGRLIFDSLVMGQVMPKIMKMMGGGMLGG